MIPGQIYQPDIFDFMLPPKKKIQMNLFQNLKIVVDSSGLHFNLF